MNSNNKFVLRLKNLRKEYDMTQQDLADKLGIVRTAIANYETNRTSPDSETLGIIADIFQVSVDYLLGRSDIKNSEQTNQLKENPNPLLEEIENLSPEDREDMKKYLEFLKMRRQLDKSKEETSSALEKDA